LAPGRLATFPFTSKPGEAWPMRWTTTSPSTLLPQCFEMLLRASIVIPFRPLPPLASVEWDSLTFAFHEVENMYISKTAEGQPFPKGSIVPFGNLSLSPAATVLHYGQGIFEGLKGTQLIFLNLCSFLTRFVVL